MTSDFFYFTWSPNVQTTCFIEPRKQFDNCWPYLRGAISCWKEWALTPECNSNGNIHFHGYFSFKDKASYKTRWFAKALPKLKYHGFVKISKVRSHLDKTYMSKDIFVMQDVVGYKLPITTVQPVSIPRVKDGEVEVVPARLVSTIYDSVTGQWVPVYEHEDGSEDGDI